jgi:hypothetical protein
MLDSFKLENVDDYFKFILLNCFIELAKIEKNKMININKPYVYIYEFITQGLDLYKSGIYNGDNFYNKLYFEKIFYHISELLKNKKVISFIIIKDSTASFLQHINTWLTAANNETLKFLNINSYDI